MRARELVWVVPYNVSRRCDVALGCCNINMCLKVPACIANNFCAVPSVILRSTYFAGRYALGSVSGGHFNPAVTFSVWLNGTPGWRNGDGLFKVPQEGACVRMALLLCAVYTTLYEFADRIAGLEVRRRVLTDAQQLPAALA